MIRQFSLAALAALVCGAASAQGVVHYREGQRVEPHEVARLLSPVPAVRTRSIRLLADPAVAPQEAEAAATGLSLPVRFSFDSARIDPSTRPQLDALAEGIKLLAPGQPVLVEGHTDAAGPAPYNQRLSQRRALVVKQYLVRVHGIDADRIKAVGIGEDQPIAGTEPAAAENRRVEFRAG